MRWSAAAPVTWPTEGQWQSVWAAAVGPLVARLHVRTDGTVDVAGADPGDPSVRLVAGEHLRPGADYRIAPELTAGVLRAWVADQRAVGIEWAPHDEPGRAHVEVQGLDRLVEVRGAATLCVLQGRLRVAPADAQLPLEVEVEVPWLRATVRVVRRPGRVEVDVHVRGLGVWWPTLAPLFLGARSSVQRELETGVQELATMLTGLATTGVLDPSVRQEPLAEVRRRHEQLLRTGMAELARRQRAVATTVAALPWWRRTRGRWRTELAALPPLTLPGDGLNYPGTWAEVEQNLTAVVLRPRPSRRDLEAAVASFTEVLVEGRLPLDVQAAAPTPRTEPWVTDEVFDLTWLATPTKLVGELS